MRMTEAIFGEGTKIENLDQAQLDELSREAKEFLQDWPQDVMSIEFRGVEKTGKSANLDVWCIEKVRELVVLLADGVDLSLDPSKVKDSDVQKIFAFLKGFSGEVDSDLQDMEMEGGDLPSKERVKYKFTVKSWKYEHGRDTIELEGDIHNIELV